MEDCWVSRTPKITRGHQSVGWHTLEKKDIWFPNTPAPLTKSQGLENLSKRQKFNDENSTSPMNFAMNIDKPDPITAPNTIERTRRILLEKNHQSPFSGASKISSSPLDFRTCCNRNKQTNFSPIGLVGFSGGPPLIFPCSIPSSPTSTVDLSDESAMGDDIEVDDLLC